LPSLGNVEETKRTEEPSIFFEGLSRAFLTMLGKRARFDLQMQVTKAKVNELSTTQLLFDFNITVTEEDEDRTVTTSRH
jgi:hypothetical protein